MSESTVLNRAQMDLLDMMSFVDSPHALAQLKRVVSDFFAQQAESEIDKMWEEGTLNEEKVEAFRNLHERTPYK